MLTQTVQGEAKVSRAIVEPAQTLLLAGAFLDLFNTAEATQGRISRVLRGQTRREIYSGLSIQMILHLLRHLGVDSLSAEKGADFFEAFHWRKLFGSQS